jgi:hypothetical protein
MTRIIPLNRDGGPNGTDAAGLSGCVGEPAQVILFPGVRYERWDDRRAAPAGERLKTGAIDRDGRDWLDI